MFYGVGINPGRSNQTMLRALQAVSILRERDVSLLCLWWIPDHWVKPQKSLIFMDAVSLKKQEIVLCPQPWLDLTQGVPHLWNFFQCLTLNIFSSDAEDFLCCLHSQLLEPSCSPLLSVQTPLAHSMPLACCQLWALNDHSYSCSFPVKRSYSPLKVLGRSILNARRKCEILPILS